MNARHVAALALIVAVAMLSGCSGPPEPVETTPAFSSEDEAFAAAEDTYRAYVDALNQVDLSDPATFEPVFALTTGDASSSLRESLSQMHADNWTVAGESLAEVIQPISFSDGVVRLAVCLDVSEVQVRDSDGESMVDADRVDVQSMLVEVVSRPESTSSPRISAFNAREGEPACVAD